MNKSYVSLLRYIPLISVSSLIFYMSSQNAVSVSDSRGVDIAIHKVAHIAEYAALYVTYIIAFYNNKRRYLENAAKGIVFVMLYGISDEIHQSFNPTRSPRYYDVLVDTLGGICGAVGVYAVMLRVKKKPSA